MAGRKTHTTDKRLKGKLSIPQLAQKLGVSRQRIHYLINSGRIKYTWIGDRMFIPEEHATVLPPPPRTRRRKA